MHPPAGEGLGLHEELRGDRTADPGRPKGHPKPYSTVLSNGTGGKQEGRAVTGSDSISFQENMTSPAFLEHLPADGKQQTNSSFCCVCMHSLCFMQQAVFISIHEFYLYPHTLLFPLPLVGSEHASVWGSAATGLQPQLTQRTHRAQGDGHVPKLERHLCWLQGLFAGWNSTSRKLKLFTLPAAAPLFCKELFVTQPQNTKGGPSRDKDDNSNGRVALTF